MTEFRHLDDGIVAAGPFAGPVAMPHAPVRKDASDPALLPDESPLAMPTQDLSARVPRAGNPETDHAWVPRAAVLVGALSLTIAFAYELYGVLSFVAMTPIQFVFLVLSTVTFGWIAFGSLSAAMGFLPLFAGEKVDTLAVAPAEGPLDARTALLFPVYHEEPHRIAGTIAAMTEELLHLGKAQNFDVFVLSDTRGANEGTRKKPATVNSPPVLAVSSTSITAAASRTPLGRPATSRTGSNGSAAGTTTSSFSMPTA